MAILNVSGFDELCEAFKRLGNVPEEVTERACNAGAAVAVEKVRVYGNLKKIRSPEPRNHILDNIKPTKFKKTPSGGYTLVTFAGEQKSSPGAKPVKNTTVAFVNEYGTSHMAARPFVGPAVTEGADEIVKPMADVLGEWMEKTFTGG
jgi:HK97 gp10 family phage protein